MGSSRPARSDGGGSSEATSTTTTTTKLYFGNLPYNYDSAQHCRHCAGVRQPGDGRDPNLAHTTKQRLESESVSRWSSQY